MSNLKVIFFPIILLVGTIISYFIVTHYYGEETQAESPRSSKKINVSEPLFFSLKSEPLNLILFENKLQLATKLETLADILGNSEYASKNDLEDAAELLQIASELSPNILELQQEKSIFISAIASGVARSSDPSVRSQHHDFYFIHSVYPQLVALLEELNDDFELINQFIQNGNEACLQIEPMLSPLMGWNKSSQICKDQISLSIVSAEYSLAALYSLANSKSSIDEMTDEEKDLLSNCFAHLMDSETNLQQSVKVYETLKKNIDSSLFLLAQYYTILEQSQKACLHLPLIFRISRSLSVLSIRHCSRLQIIDSSDSAIPIQKLNQLTQQLFVNCRKSASLIQAKQFSQTNDCLKNLIVLDRNLNDFPTDLKLATNLSSFARICYEKKSSGDKSLIQFPIEIKKRIEKRSPYCCQLIVQVFNESTCSPVEDAQVSILEFPDLSYSQYPQGNYIFHLNQQGNYTVNIDCAGYLPYSETININPKQIKNSRLPVRLQQTQNKDPFKIRFLDSRTNIAKRLKGESIVLSELETKCNGRADLLREIRLIFNFRKQLLEEGFDPGPLKLPEALE